MNILIIGCGRLGARLANIFDEQRHDVSVIDKDALNFDLLDDDFSGLTVQGTPFDMDVMRSAGMEGCDYVICVTHSDNINLMCGQIARRYFDIKNVLVRVTDPQKARIYDELGVYTICPTKLAFEEICSGLFDSLKNNKLVHYGGSSLELSTIPFEKHMKGKKLSEFADGSDYKLLGTLDENHNIQLYRHTEDRPIKENDQLLFVSVID